MEITILGAGAFGTALSINLSKYHSITLWSFDSNHVEEMLRDKENKQFFKNNPLLSNIKISSNLEESIKNSDLLIYMVPMNAFREVLNQVKALGYDNLPFIWGCKGLEKNTSLQGHEIVEEIKILHNKYGVISGPTFAKEIAKGLPCAAVLASNNQEWVNDLIKNLSTTTMRFYSNDDMAGVELGGALKNIIAIASGISDGLSYGFNSRAALITRGIAEITRFSYAKGAKEKTMMGLAGMGDLILTCTGNISRNYQVGLKLAEGKDLEEILSSLGNVAEGVNSVYEIKKLATKYNIEMPIVDLLYKFFNKEILLKDLMPSLMNRPTRAE